MKYFSVILPHESSLLYPSLQEIPFEFYGWQLFHIEQTVKADLIFVHCFTHYFIPCDSGPVSWGIPQKYLN